MKKYMCVCLYACYLHVCTCNWLSAYVPARVCLSVCVPLYEYVREGVYACVRVFVCAICVYACVFG